MAADRFQNGLKGLSYSQERRSFVIDGRGHHARISAESWRALEDICCFEGLSLQQLVEQVLRHGGQRSLSVELEMFALAYFQAACAPESLHKMAPANLLPC